MNTTIRNHQDHIRRNRYIISLLLAAISFAPIQPFALQTALATRGYEARVATKELDVYMNVGENRTIILSYENIGDQAWYRSSAKAFVSLYLVGKTSSVLYDTSWRTKDSPALITDYVVNKGNTGTVLFKIYGSKPGDFTETFRLASENTAWMYGGETKVTVHVKEGYKHPSTLTTAPSPAPTPTISPTPVVSAPAPVSTKLTTTLLLRSTKLLTLGGDDTANVTLGFKNTSAVNWDNMSLKIADVHSATVSGSLSVYHPSWISPSTPAKENMLTKPGEIGFISFTLKAPPKRGNYTVRMQLVANGEQTVDGGFVDIPVTVTSDGTVQLNPPITPPPSLVQPAPGEILKHPSYLVNEPIIRVGLFVTTDDKTVLTSVSGPFHVIQNGATICDFNQGEEVTILFDRVNKVYKVTGPRCTSQSTVFYQVQSTVGPWEPLRMTDFSRPVSWLPGANDNTFRGIIELRWSEAHEEVWAINELPMEMYLYGLAETSDLSPLEYQKALLTAARTYAHYHWTRGTKHAADHYHIDAKYDQVYRGYGAEARSPTIVRAVQETRGQIVTYEGRLAITPYFSRSDGRTRNWEEVWGGDPIPWLRSVPVPQDEGRTLWGHGVGMSATGAMGMAKEGTMYQDILKHFYTNTSLMLFY